MYGSCLAPRCGTPVGPVRTGFEDVPFRWTERGRAWSVGRAWALGHTMPRARKSLRFSEQSFEDGPRRGAIR